MSDDELYTDRYDEEDLRQVLGLQTEEYRHLQTQAFRLIRIVVAIITVIAATVSLQLLSQVTGEPLTFSLALNDTAAERLLLGSEQKSISLSGANLRRLGIGPVNQKLGSRLGILSAVLTIEAVAYSLIVIISEPLKPVIGVDNEANGPQSSKESMGKWVNQNIQKLRRITRIVRISYFRLATAILSGGLAIAIIIFLKNASIWYLVLIDGFVVATTIIIIGIVCYLTYTHMTSESENKRNRIEYLELFGPSFVIYLIMVAPIMPRMIDVVWKTVWFIPHL